MPAQHQYRDANIITWAHETTHGLQSRIRNENFEIGFRKNAFYVLEGRAMLCIEPSFLMSDYVSSIPSSLRGNIYQIYMVQQQGDWNDTPMYPWDEWTAYANGTANRIELDRAEDADEVQHMLEMMVYSAHVLLHDDDTDSDAAIQRRRAFAWLATRSFSLLDQSEDVATAWTYWQSVLSHGTDVLSLFDDLEIDYPTEVPSGVVVSSRGTSGPPSLKKAPHRCNHKPDYSAAREK